MVVVPVCTKYKVCRITVINGCYWTDEIRTDSDVNSQCTFDYGMCHRADCRRRTTTDRMDGKAHGYDTITSFQLIKGTLQMH